MSLEHYKEAVKFIARHANHAAWSGPCSLKSIDKAEEILAIKLPNTFRLFLATFGTGHFGSNEFYGIDQNDITMSQYDSFVYNNILYRKNCDHAHHLILFYEVGDGTFLALNTARFIEDECPVVRCFPLPHALDDELEICAEDFGEMFLTLITEAYTRIEKRNKT